VFDREKQIYGSATTNSSPLRISLAATEFQKAYVNAEEVLGTARRIDLDSSSLSGLACWSMTLLSLSLSAMGSLDLLTVSIPKSLKEYGSQRHTLRLKAP
jgi:hypothetical protein